MYVVCSRYQCDICPDYKARKLEFVATHKLRKHGVLTETFVKYECDVEGCDFFTLFDTIIAQHNKTEHTTAESLKDSVNDTLAENAGLNPIGKFGFIFEF